MARQLSLRRPRTAPSSGTATMDDTIPPIPMLPLDTQDWTARPQLKASPSQGRTESGVIRDVDAWLDASLPKPPAPLMGGLSYWREAVPAGAHGADGVQYAIPIVQGTDPEKPAASHGQQIKSFCRRAIRIPSLRKDKTQCEDGADQNPRPTSDSAFAIPYAQMEQGEAPIFIDQFTHSAARSSTGTASSSAMLVEARNGLSYAIANASHRRVSPRFQGLELDKERHLSGSSGSTGGGHLRRIPANGHFPREDSVGSFSSAPTYFSGPPPPSYHSRPASVLSTSSFGCIDGMNPEQRQISQKRAAQRQRGMKGRLRRLAQRANVSL